MTLRIVAAVIAASLACAFVSPGSTAQEVSREVTERVDDWKRLSVRVVKIKQDRDLKVRICDVRQRPYFQFARNRGNIVPIWGS